MAHVKVFQRVVKRCIRSVEVVCDRANNSREVSGRDARAWSASYAHRCDTRKNIADVFTVGNQTEQSLRLTTKSCAFAFGKSAPDAVTFSVRERVLEAIETNFAIDTNPFRGITRAASFREEEVWIFASTKSFLLPVVSDPPHAGFPRSSGRCGAPRLGRRPSALLIQVNCYRPTATDETLTTTRL